MTGNGNKKEISDGKIKYQVCLGGKSPTILNPHWGSWPMYLTTTTVVLIVLQKRNFFCDFVSRKEMQ